MENIRETMGSEMRATSVDFDGSVSWEDFFGTSTDLVPQLLGMFDELARNKGETNNHVNDQIPTSIQKRLSLVAVHSQRNTIFGQICAGKTEQATMQQENRVTDPSLERRASPQSTRVEITVCSEKENDEIKKSVDDDQQRDVCINKILYERNDKNTLTPQYGRRRKHLDRPLSGSSIASSTSSSGCSNQGNAGSNNPYLASVESLADTCASSQGSGDSGVVTKSEASSRIRGPISHPRNSTIDPSLPFFFHRARYCDPQRNPVEKVLLEIVDTEAIYVEHLRQVIQGYLIFWRDDPASLLQQPELNNLFSNIEDIFQFNREFLDEIEACGLDAVKVANTFTKRNSGFKVYTEFCTNYPRIVETLTDLMGREETAEAFRERQAALCHPLPLGSFLLKPVQRILKYHLLLENLSKEYGTGEQNLGNCEGQKAIGEALEAMTGIAKHINAMKRKHEHAVRVQEIQSLLYGWPGRDLTTSGELVAEGRFRMRGAKAPRHAFLFERMLLLTKKKEDGLLVYKAHIMCSNLMLIESIPGEPCSFHVIPFDNPRLQYTLQARNLEQKREWTLQIKRVMLENYNAVIPIHARQLVLQLGQTQQDDDVSYDRISMKKQYSSPPEYLKRRKQEKERRRSEASFRQKGKKVFKSGTTENSPSSTRKINSTDEPRDRSLSRSIDGRASKVRDRFTSWRRKSEPGFQSYVSLNQSDGEQIENNDVPVEAEVVDENIPNEVDDSEGQNQEKNNTNTKDVNEQQKQSPSRTVEEIVGHILMQNQEFQRLLEKQRNNSMANVRQQQRFNKHHVTVDTSDDSDTGDVNYPSDLSSNNNSSLSISLVNNNTKGNRFSRKENRLVRSNNAWNSRTSPQGRESSSNLKLQYNNLKIDNDKAQTDVTKNKENHRIYEKRAMFESFKRQSIVTESKIIQTALRIRENTSCEGTRNSEKPKNDDDRKVEEIIHEDCDSTLSIGNYDNFEHVWQQGLGNRPDADSPTRPAVWLTKLCEGLPTSPQKCGSLPRSFQMSPSPQEAITKARFLQRDGKPMTERPFTIASDKPAEINLEDMERYASSYQPEGRIAKFPTSASASSTFSCSLDDNLTDAGHMTVPETNIHPDHKIYRANLGSGMLKSVLSKAGSRLQGLRSTVSAEALESADDYGRNKKQCNKGKKKSKGRLSRESSTDVDEPSVGCIPSNSTFLLPSHYYKQGSSGLGARIAQADYADPSVLFFDSKRPDSTMSEEITLKTAPNLPDSNPEEVKKEKNPSETDSFYERFFETIENYVDPETDDVFRDSAIFSDAEEVPVNDVTCSPENIVTRVKVKVAPPVPVKQKPKPIVARKPENLKIRAKTVRKIASEPRCIKVTISSTNQSEILKKSVEDKNDVSAGQCQAGWVKKMVGQLQSQIES